MENGTQGERIENMSLRKRSRNRVKGQIVVSVALTTLVVLVTLLAFSASQNVIIVLSTAVMAVIGVMQFIRDASS